MTSHDLETDPELDLVLERTVDVRPALVWAAWTRPELLVQWFTPRPWTTTDCKIDLRPGGRFDTVMRSPEGQEFPNAGCYLEVVPERRLVWTNALLAGFRPAPASATCGDEDASFTFTRDRSGRAGVDLDRQLVGGAARLLARPARRASPHADTDGRLRPWSRSGSSTCSGSRFRTSSRSAWG
jgi:uncharacterized protein YndB with AHSA1/START domain